MVDKSKPYIFAIHHHQAKASNFMVSTKIPKTMKLGGDAVFKGGCMTFDICSEKTLVQNITC